MPSAAREALLDLLATANLWQRAALPAVKADRPTKEPGRADKLRAEGKLAAVVQAFFARMTKKVTVKLNSAPPKQAAVKADYTDTTFDSEFFTDDEFESALEKVLTTAAQGGVLQFTDMVALEIDQSAVNKEAAAAIKTYTFDLVKNLDDSSRKSLRLAISDFITSPGMTMADVIDRLPFTESRASLIATTEITRAYATGQSIAGEAVAIAWPDVPVTKMWHTNNDSLVCPICDPLDGTEAPQDGSFDDEYDAPPAHPGCRCWVSYRTNING